MYDANGKKKGTERVHHFAHKNGTNCSDDWDYSSKMTEWHYNWQHCFPEINCEVAVQLGNVRHRADVLVGNTVIEFQHSILSADIFSKRNNFYHDLGYKVVWLFDLSEDYNNGKIRLIANSTGNEPYWIVEWESKD